MVGIKLLSRIWSAYQGRLSSNPWRTQLLTTGNRLGFQMITTTMMFKYLSDILICSKKHVSFEIVVCFIHLVTK